jgi:hypothetical protein
MTCETQPGSEVVRKNILVIVVTIFGFAMSAFAQGTLQKDGVYPPTDEQIAHNKRIAEMLKHPTFITLRLTSTRRDVPREEPSTTPSPYTIDEGLNFQIFITQEIGEALVITDSAGSDYREYRPELIRDGDLVPYSPETTKQIESAYRNLRSGSVWTRAIPNGQECALEVLNLKSWYDLPLKPGHYQLIVKKQFAWDGDWVESNPVTFDVIARRTAALIPDCISVRLVPEGINPSREGQYRLAAGSRIAVELVNDCSERVYISVIDRYYGHRVQLTKNGETIPYSAEAAKVIESKEKDPRLVEKSPNLFLDPKTTSRLDGFSLNQWFGPLAVGVYRLTDRRRFDIEGPWTKESPALLLEIVP